MAQRTQQQAKISAQYILLLSALQIIMKYAIIILILLSSCSAIRGRQAKNKTEWLIKHGYLANKSDTVIHYDTIKGFRLDTVFVGSILKDIDTFYLENSGIETRTIVKWKERIINQTLSKRDTVIQWKEITHTKIIKQPEKYIPWWAWLIIVALGHMVLGLVLGLKKLR
jgi:hypothetical protein